MDIWEYCTVSYGVENHHYQKIRFIYINGLELIQWKGKSWPTFLTQMGREGWEMTGVGISNDPGLDSGIIFFKRLIEES